MLTEPAYTLETLFEQLGLPSDSDAIDRFIAQHHLEADQALHDASFWNSSQASFLRESIVADAAWAEVVDELNLMLHAD